jgi:hypothetical protein
VAGREGGREGGRGVEGGILETIFLSRQKEVLVLEPRLPLLLLTFLSSKLFPPFGVMEP